MGLNIPLQYLLIGVIDLIIVIVLIAFFIRSGRTKNETSVIDASNVALIQAGT